MSGCSHDCCSDPDPLHDHFLRPVDCPRCKAGRTATPTEEDQMSGQRHVADLTRHDFGQRVTVEGHGSGWLYAIHDDYHDGYPDRTLILVTNERGDTAEWTFTDSDPSGYPKTMCLPVEVSDA